MTPLVLVARRMARLAPAVAIVLMPWGALAESAAHAAAGVAIAPPGLCAEPPVDLVSGPRAPRLLVAEAERGAAGAAQKRFSPDGVAAGLPPMAVAAPSTQGFQGLQACDVPGSGCLGAIQPAPAAPAAPRPAAPSVDIPPPTSPCGGPGFPCP